jgi:hypothetical protein
MRLPENIERFVKNRKPHVAAGADIDKRVLDDSFAAMEETMRAKSVVNQPNIRRIIMKSRITKLSAAAVIIVAVVIGISHFSVKDITKFSVQPQTAKSVAAELHGPLTHRFPDGSQVELAEGAKIRLYDSTNRRGFEHVTGEIEVFVTKGDNEFVITSVFGAVKALGTAFKMDIVRVDSTDLLAVKVEEGVVEVSNAKGSKIIRENQRLTVEKDKAPYDFQQDKNLPPRLIERIQTMLDAVEKSDKKAWLANFNINALYDLAKGKIKYEQHSDWFSGMSPDDAKNFRQALADVNSPEQIKEIMLADIKFDGVCKLYVLSVTLDEDGKHAKAVCVKKLGQTVGFTPQWTFFDDDWWQTDD